MRKLYLLALLLVMITPSFSSAQAVGAVSPAPRAVPSVATLAPLPTAMKIMTMGDSRAEGGTVSGTGDADRWALLSYLIFVDQLYGTAFVGDHTFGPHALATSAHSGWQTSNIIASAPAQIAASNPDLILLEIGVNNARALGETGPVIASHIADALNVILAASPTVRVILADIVTPWNGTTNDVASVAVADANELLPGVVTAAGPRVSLAKMTVGMSNKWLSDGLHNGVDGYQIKAWIWRECMRDLMAPGQIRAGQSPLYVPVAHADLCQAP